MTEIEKAGLICALEMDTEFRERVRALLDSPAPRPVERPAAQAPRATERPGRSARPIPPRSEPDTETPVYRPASNPQRAVRDVRED